MNLLSELADTHCSRALKTSLIGLFRVHKFW